MTTETTATIATIKAVEPIASDQLSSALKTLDIEIDALEQLKHALTATALGEAFEAAVKLFSANEGRIVLTGIGKSGHVARKIAATLCSTGTPAFFLHPVEASHGDLGAISRSDIVLAISWSGATSELGDIVAYCQSKDIPLVVATSRPDQWIAERADICLPLPSVREACPNNVAPTSSTTVQMVLGDALAVALTKERGFSPSNFRAFHPGGKLGAQLTTIEQVMGTGDALPRVPEDASLRSATLEMSLKRYGCTAVVDGEGRLVGAFTDGDLRRCITLYDLDDGIAAHMSPSPVTAGPSTRAIDALTLMNDSAVSVLFVTADEKLLGMVHMHDLIRLGIA